MNVFDHIDNEVKIVIINVKNKLECSRNNCTIFKSLDDLIKKEYNGIGFLKKDCLDIGTYRFIYYTIDNNGIQDFKHFRWDIYECSNCGIIKGHTESLVNMSKVTDDYKGTYHFCGVCGELIYIQTGY
ncbi:MAG: hypothetical protein WC376_01555 [Candidatus Nanoarchaeia archaeon]|jgi:hypothetical protein